MKLYLECIPCLTNQIVNSVRLFVENETKQYQLIQESIKTLAENIDIASSSPILAGMFHNRLKNETGIEDLYAQEKQFYNQFLLSIADEFRKIINGSDHPVKTALILCSAANIIDFGICAAIDKNQVIAKITDSRQNIHQPNDINFLLDDLSKSRTLLYIGDNCGEIVLDRLVIETIKHYYPKLDITFAVRDAPILNDVTVKEAQEVGLDKLCRIISSSSAIPGTVINNCTETFQSLYRESDIKILKGMGNLETALKDEKDAYFLFMAKCDVMTKLLNCKMHDICIVKGNPLYK